MYYLEFLVVQYLQEKEEKERLARIKMRRKGFTYLIYPINYIKTINLYE